MRNAIVSSVMLILTSFFFMSAAHADSQPADSTGSWRLPPSEIHKIMADAKARRLEEARFSEAVAPQASMVYDQAEYDVNFYGINISVTIPLKTIYGDVLMEAKAVVDGLDSIEVDLYSNLIIDSIYTPTRVLDFSRIGDKILLPLDGVYNHDEVFSFSVAYHGQPLQTGFVGFSFDVHNGIPIASTLSEPMGARSWWPCKDRPDDKADSLDITIKCDTAYFCVSNGKLVDTARNGDGSWTFNYEVRYPISTYLFAVTISKYNIWSNWYHYGTNDSMIITHFVYPDRYEYSPTHYNITPYAVGVLAGLFGEYPFVEEKYGHVNFVWDGGMEHQTVTSMVGNDDFGFDENVVVHELSHQWWGDMITCNSWHDIWLNEGFASYCEALYFEVKEGDYSFHSYINSMSYYGGGSVYIEDTTSVYSIFGSIVYDKGAWVLHMLRHIVGDTTFFDIMRAYYNSAYKYKTATTAQFQELCESVSGKDLDYFFNEWIYGTYYPKYYWSYMSEQDPTDGKYWTYLQLYQGQTSYIQTFVMPIDLIFTYPARLDTTLLLNDVRNNVYIFKSDQAPTDVVLDPDKWILRQSFESGWTYHQIPFPLDSARQYVPYLDSIIVRGGSGNNRFSIVTGYLPSGLTLDSTTGFITGTPSLSGEFTFGVKANDANSSAIDTTQYTMLVRSTSGTPGDGNNDGGVNLIDIAFIIDYLYKGGSNPPVPSLADPDASCAINILDVSYLVNYLYRGGDAPQMGCVAP